MTVADKDRWCVDCYPEHVQAVIYHDEDPVCEKHFRERTGAASSVVGDSAEKEKAVMEFPLCKCGCGERTRSNRSPYIKGHNPDTRSYKSAGGDSSAPQRRAQKKTRRMPPRNSRTTQPEMATVQMPVSRLDNWWLELSVEEKAAIYSAQFDN